MGTLEASSGGGMFLLFEVFFWSQDNLSFIRSSAPLHHGQELRGRTGRRPSPPSGKSRRRLTGTRNPVMGCRRALGVTLELPRQRQRRRSLAKRRCSRTRPCCPYVLSTGRATSMPGTFGPGLRQGVDPPRRRCLDETSSLPDPKMTSARRRLL